MNDPGTSGFLIKERRGLVRPSDDRHVKRLIYNMKSPILCLLLCGSVLAVESYPDGRPACKVRLDAKDQGIVLRYGDGPDKCDYLGARDVWVYQNKGKYYMHYDGAGHKGWLACLAESPDLVHWTKMGPVLDKGEAGMGDSATASYGTTYFDGKEWHMFYVGCPNCTQPPDCVPAGPYLTMKAKGASATGPWTKQYDVVPVALKPGSYYAETASPGFVVKHGGEYLQFVSVAAGGKRYHRHCQSHESRWIMEDGPRTDSSAGGATREHFHVTMNLRTRHGFSSPIMLESIIPAGPSSRTQFGCIGRRTSTGGMQPTKRWCWIGRTANGPIRSSACPRCCRLATSSRCSMTAVN